MATRCNRAAAPTGQQNGQIVVVVPVAVANGAAVNNHAVVEQRSFAFLDGFHFAQETRELLHVKMIYLRDFFLFRLVVLMVGKGVVAFRHANGRIRAIVAVVRRDEGDDTSRVALESQRHHVIHQLQVFFVLLGNTSGTREIRL